MEIFVGLLIFLAVGATYAVIGGTLDRGHQIYRDRQWEQFKKKHNLS